MWNNLIVLANGHLRDEDSALPWAMLETLINSRWKRLTGIYLTSEQKAYLKKKVTRENTSRSTVTYEQICRYDAREGPKFSFWVWIQAAMKSAKESNLKKLAKGEYSRDSWTKKPPKEFSWTSYLGYLF